MELCEAQSHGQLVDEVLSDAVIIANKKYEQSLYVVDNQVHLWDLQNFAELTLKDLQPLMAISPQLILIGVAQFSANKWLYDIQNSIQHDLIQRGISCEITSLSAACNTWNIIQSEQRRTCLALIRSR